MSELIMLVMILLLSIFGGTVATIILFGKSEKRDTRIKMILTWILNCYFEFWILNCFRFVLLKGNIILSYAQDGFVLFFDIILMIGSIFILYYCYKAKKRKSSLFEVISIICLVIYYIVVLLLGILRYENVNAAIYDVLLPKSHLFGGVILFVCQYMMTYTNNSSKSEIKVAVAVLSLFIVTVFIYPGMETYLTNVDEFSFSLKQIWYWYILFILLVSVGVSIIYFLFMGKLKEIFLFMLWSFSICAYVQGMFLNGKLFLMDGKEAEWSVGFKLGNFMIWVLLLGVLYFAYRLISAKRKELLVYSSAVLCIMQLVAGISLIPSCLSQESKGLSTNDYLSTEGLYEVAKEENIIMFVLDTYDVDYVNEILTQKPDFLEPLNGFTYFPDTVSQFSRTFPSVPYMLTEELHFYEKPLNEYVDEAFEKCSFWEQMKEQGYQLYFFEEDENYIGESIRVIAGNYAKEGHVIKERISFKGCAEAIVRINNYRILPYALKEYYMYTSGIISDLVVKEREWDMPAFVANDIEVFEQFKKNKLQISDESKALRFIHLNGAHAPYTMAEDGTKAEEGTISPISQYIGSMNLVYNYLEMLQQLGVYENSTIVITADHGENYVTTHLEQNTNPILFIKPAGADLEKELIVSDVYASQNDIIPTLSGMYEIEYAKDWGINLFLAQDADKSRVRYHYYTVVENGIQTKARTYEINGSSLDFNNWNATDEYHEFGEYY
ncbi:MAG: hypothetical protein UHN47_00950 [Lachnospiraceae bacterium]|nr:hypothetical protein [Lachnospiraceae bacterium]